jgi:hypothetical protein
MAIANTLTGAASWASYFVNGDASGLSAEEKTAADAWLARELSPGEHVVSTEGEPWVSRSFDLYTGTGIRCGELLKYRTLRPADFEVQNEGSIFLLRPKTDAGREWIAANIDDDAPRFGGAVAVEHRYIAIVVEGAQADGLSVE